MSKSKKQPRPGKPPTDPSSRNPAGLPRKPRAPRPPAWRGRIGLIVAFFAITIGGGYLVMYGNDLFGLLGLAPDKIPSYGFRVVAKYPHDSSAFTEGLLYHDGTLYESTGPEGQSTLRKIDLASDQVRIVKLDPKYFGEGLVLWRDRLIQLTYDSELAMCYDLQLKPLEQTYRYEGQGWGLTHDGQFLIMSNGTSELQFRNPETFALDHRLPVTAGGRRASRLNELEYVDGKIYANVWHDDRILEIDPQSGYVTARIDLRNLLPREQRPNHPEAVLNGIAYNTESKRFIVTGKYWPYLYEIELVPPNKK